MHALCTFGPWSFSSLGQVSGPVHSGRYTRSGMSMLNLIRLIPMTMIMVKTDAKTWQHGVDFISILWYFKRKSIRREMYENK